MSLGSFLPGPKPRRVSPSAAQYRPQAYPIFSPKHLAEDIAKCRACEFKAREERCPGVFGDTTEQGPARLRSLFHGLPSPFSLQQRLKRWEDVLDDYPIALSCRMNAIGLVERGRSCHTIEKKWNQRHAILLR